MDFSRHARNLALVGVLACVAGCSGPGPAASVTAGPYPSPSPSSATTAQTPDVPSASGDGRSPVPISPSPAASSGPDLALDLHTLPEAWASRTGPAVATDGTEIVWSSISSFNDAGEPLVADIAAVTPGGSDAPHLIYLLPDRDSMIWSVAVRHGHYAFLELNQRLLGENGWRLWALAGPNAQAVLLDRRDGPKDDPRPAPAIALTDDSVIWTVVHDRRGVPTYELRAARFDDSDARALLSTPVKTMQYWYPSTDPDGTHLVYATVERVGTAYRFRVWMLDLAVAKAAPVPLGDSEEATQPVTNGNMLAWRVVDGNVANWGKGLVVGGADGSNTRTLPVTQLSRVSIGRRFVAFDTIDGSSLVLYDTQQGSLITVERHAPPDTFRLQRGWTVVAGDLLVFRRVNMDETSASTPPQVVWALLPAPGG